MVWIAELLRYRKERDREEEAIRNALLDFYEGGSKAMWSCIWHEFQRVAVEVALMGEKSKNLEILFVMSDGTEHKPTDHDFAFEWMPDGLEKIVYVKRNGRRNVVDVR